MTTSSANPLLPFFRAKRYTPPSQYLIPDSHLASTDLVSQPTWFETFSKPGKMGNAADIAYGGYALGMSVFSALLHLENSGDPSDAGFVVYSAQGNYLRPAFIDRNFIMRVGTLRRTRTFRTMEVRIYQISKDGKALDLCLTAVVDLMAASPKSDKDATVVTFQSKPTPPLNDAVPHHTALPSSSDVRGAWPESVRKPFEKLFAPMLTFLDTKLSPKTGIWGENAFGLLKGVKSSQDQVDIVDKRGYDWLRAKGSYVLEETQDKYLPFSQYAANVAILAWIMDAKLSFTPLSFTDRFFDAVKACASLDFSIRFHQEYDIGLITDSAHPDSPWFLREIKTLQSGFERSYTEGCIWRDTAGSHSSQQTDFGKLKCIATMTQASVLKSWPDKSKL